MIDKEPIEYAVTVRTQWSIEHFGLWVITAFNSTAVIRNQITYLSLHICVLSDLEKPCQS